MTVQDKYDTALFLLQSLGKMKQKEIAAALKTANIKRSSESYLSKAKSETYQGTNYRKNKGELSDALLLPIVEGLEGLLNKTLQITFDPISKKYINASTGEKYDSVYKTKLVPGLGQENTGIVQIYETIPSTYINQAIADSEEIRIIQTYLTGVESLKLSFEHALKNGASIKILLMEPELESARLRAKGLINKQVNVRNKIIDNRLELEELHQKYPDQFQIAYYNEIPGLNLFAFDDKLLIGWYWYKQYAIYGTYLEIQDESQYPLAKNVNDHWNKLWKSSKEEESAPMVYYRCYFLREGERQTFLLEINNFSKEVRLIGTPSGTEYRGDMINLTAGFCRIRVETIKQGNTYNNRSKRVANFLVNIGNFDNLGKQEVAIAVYSNVSPQGLAYGNIMVLLKVDGEDRKVETETQRYIFRFLENSEIKIANSNISNLEGLKSVLLTNIEESKSNLRMNFLRKMSGEYIYYTKEKTPDGKNFIQPRTLKINSDGNVEFRGNTIDSKGIIKFINAQNIMIYKETDINIANYYYILQPSNSGMTELFGFYMGISVINQPKGAGILLVKQDKRPHSLKNIAPIYFDSEDFDKLLIRHPKMNEIFY